MKNHLFKRMSSALMAGVLALGLMAVPAGAAESNQLVEVDLWHATSNKASMGNVATDNNSKALYNPSENTLQVATNPVSVSGYQSAITKAQYDITGKGSYKDVEILSTGTVQTGDKYDGTDHAVTYISSFEIELPDYITGEGVEYIPLHMMVPYTPMDEVVGEGYLDARLRIDWDQVETTSLTQIQPDNTMSSGEIESVDTMDEDTGVRLVTDSAKVASTTAFQVEEISSGSDYDKAKRALSGVSGEFTLYSIKLITSAETETEPFGAVTLVFPYSGSLEMYRINTNSTKTVLRGTETEEGYEIMTSKLGLFAVFGGAKIDVKPSTGSNTGSNTGTTTNPNASASFTDISGHWAREYIVRAVNEGLFAGTSATTFSPDTSMTAGMVITVLYRMAGSPATSLPDSMENVAEGSWYEIACAWGYNNGIIGGYKTFYPDQPVSRQELATMLYKYYGLTQTPYAGGDLSKFTDASSAATWAADALAWANAAGIVSGTSATTLSPETGASRAQVATMLCRYLDYAG
jgi:hypothetical protein